MQGYRRTPRKLQTTAAALGAAALIAIAPQVADAVTPQPRLPGPLPAEVTAQGVSVHSEIGSYCVDGEPHGNTAVGMCADKIPSKPGPAHTLRVTPRTPLRIVFRDHPRLQDTVESASATLLRFDEDGRPKGIGSVVPLERHGKSWALTLPKKLHRANALALFTSLEGGQGDITHYVGLQSRRRQPLECPGKAFAQVQAKALRGLDVQAATAEAKSRGCELRVVRIDGVDQAITEDLSLSRVNVFIRGGLVVGVDGFY